MKKSAFLLLFLLLAFADVSFGQCAMCKAVAESSTNGGSSVAAGLNDGILYLMAAPYLLLGSIGFAWYKYSSSKKLKA